LVSRLRAAAGALFPPKGEEKKCKVEAERHARQAYQHARHSSSARQGHHGGMRTVLITLIGPERTSDLVVDADTTIEALLPNLLVAGGVPESALAQPGWGVALMGKQPIQLHARRPDLPGARRRHSRRPRAVFRRRRARNARPRDRPARGIRRARADPQWRSARGAVAARRKSGAVPPGRGRLLRRRGRAAMVQLAQVGTSGRPVEADGQGGVEHLVV